MRRVVYRSKGNLLLFLVALIVVSIIIPFGGDYGRVILTGMIIAFGIVLNPRVLSYHPFILMLLFVFFQISYSLVGKGLPFNLTVFQSLYYFSAIIVCYNFINFQDKQIIILRKLLILTLALAFICTFFALLTDSMVLRNNANDADSLYVKTSTFGVFTYEFGESLAIILPALTAYAFGEKKRIVQILLFALTVLGIIIQVMGALATSALLSFGFSLAVLLFSFRGAKNRLRTILTLSVIGITLLIILPSIQFQENLTLLTKMEDISESYSSGQSVGGVEERSTLYKQSLKVCLHNPILGLGDVPEEYGKYTSNTVSLHTAFFDYWGLFGLFVVFFILSWKGSIKESLNRLNSDKKRRYRWAYLSLLGLLLFKGPVSIGLNFFVSTVFISLLILSDNNRTIKLEVKDV